MIHTFSQDQNLSLIYWALQSLDTLSNTESYQLLSLFRETPLRKRLYHRHEDLHRKKQAAHKDKKVYTRNRGSWMHRCSTKDGAHPDWDTPELWALLGVGFEVPGEAVRYGGHNNKPSFSTCPFHKAQIPAGTPPTPQFWGWHNPEITFLTGTCEMMKPTAVSSRAKWQPMTKTNMTWLAL